MKKINFKNNSEPAINGENLNQMQDNIEDEIHGTILYESNTFATTGTLKDTILNYKRIKVYAKSSDNHNVIQELLTSQVNSNGNLFTSFWAGSQTEGYFYGKSARLILNNNNFTLDRLCALELKSNNTIKFTEYNAYTILKIVGFNY